MSTRSRSAQVQTRASSSKMGSIIALAMGLGLSASCSVSAGSTQGAKQEQTAFRDEPALPSSADEETQEYILQPGDLLEIKAFNIEEIEDTVTVRPDGRISLLLLDDIVAAGLTPAQLDESLTRHYSFHYRSPRITVVVRSFANQKIYVGGEVNGPTLIPLVGQLTAAGAIFQAGGFRSTAKQNEVLLIRKGVDGTAVIREIDVQEILTGEANDPVLHPFDVLYVPKTGIAKVGQFVQQYVRAVIPFTLTAGFSYILGDQFRIEP